MFLGLSKFSYDAATFDSANGGVTCETQWGNLCEQQPKDITNHACILKSRIAFFFENILLVEKKMVKKSPKQTVACHAVVKPYTLC